MSALKAQNLISKDFNQLKQFQLFIIDFKLYGGLLVKTKRYNKASLTLYLLVITNMSFRPCFRNVKTKKNKRI